MKAAKRPICDACDLFMARDKSGYYCVACRVKQSGEKMNEKEYEFVRECHRLLMEVAVLKEDAMCASLDGRAARVSLSPTLIMDAVKWCDDLALFLHQNRPVVAKTFELCDPKTIPPRGKQIFDICSDLAQRAANGDTLSYDAGWTISLLTQEIAELKQRLGERAL